MANALKFHAVVSGKRLTLADLGAFEGKRVEVIVMEEEDVNDEQTRRPLPKRHFGTLAGKMEIAPDFDAPLPPDIQRYFDGEGDGE